MNNLRRSGYVKFLAGIFLGIALYCEWFVYMIQPVYWPKLSCADEQTCTRILFIADPQIQGDLAVSPPFNYIFNWDSDRYLEATFSVVVNHFKPQVLVYLGDLMDEGSVATMPQFHNYAKRIFNIFQMDYPVVQVWLPGDNDIGGENESVKKDKVAEFQRIFDQPSIITTHNISFYKVNGITHDIPAADSNRNYRIVVSHYPVTLRSVFGNQVNKEIEPNIYFCAHSHDSKYVTMDKDLSQRKTIWFNSGNRILEVLADAELLYEVNVPTCSYRMGTNYIGYGAAILDDDNNLRYTVFWSPRRFPYLFFYLALLIIVILYSIVFCAAKLFYRKSAYYINSSDKVPLIQKC